MPSRAMRSRRRAAAEPAGVLALRTVREAASYARVSQQTIRRWLKTGQLKSYRVGRQIRIHQNDLDDFIGSRELRWL